MYNIRSYLLLLVGISVFMSCRKSSYLDESPDSSWVIPETIEDFTALLDNANVMNGNGGGGSVSFIGELTADNYYLLNSQIASTDPDLLNLYLWNDNIGKYSLFDWTLPYRAILYSNIVLDGLKSGKASSFEPTTSKNLRGRALFYRAFMNFSLSQVFCPQYEPELAGNQLGLPLRKSSQVTENLKRSTLRETYESIISDLNESRDCLSIIDELKTRPTKLSSSALLAKVYLQMGKYDSSLKYSSECISIKPELLDYNDIIQTSTTTSPFQRYNNEVIFHAIGVSVNTSNNMFLITRYRIDTSLYDLYKPEDLRKKYFFRTRPDGRFTFRGSYDGTAQWFSGIAIDEIYLIKAESLARQGSYIEAIEVLNNLLIKRYVKDEFTPEVAANSEEALTIILSERRKELLFRGIRWMDIRRLNLQGANIKLYRKVNEQAYTLEPNDKKYTLLIPPDVMAYNNGWPQNPR